MFRKWKNSAEFCERYRAADVACSEDQELAEFRRVVAPITREARVPPFGNSEINVTECRGIEQLCGGLVPDQSIAADKRQRPKVEKAFYLPIAHIIKHQELWVDICVHRKGSELRDASHRFKKYDDEIGALCFTDFYSEVIHIRMHLLGEIDILTEKGVAAHSRLKNALQLVPSVEPRVDDFTSAEKHAKLVTTVEVAKQIAEQERQALKNGVNLIHSGYLHPSKADSRVEVQRPTKVLLTWVPTASIIGSILNSVGGGRVSRRSSPNSSQS